jgi:predicted ester cyclase
MKMRNAGMIDQTGLRLLVIGAVLCALTLAGPPDANGASPQFERNARVAKRAFEIYQAHATDRYEEVYAQDIEVIDGGESTRGLETFRAVGKKYFDAFPDLKVTVDAQYQSGDTVITRWTIRASKLAQPLFGVRPRDVKLEVTGVYIDRIRGGKIDQRWESWDEGAFLEQLGAVKIPAE